MRLRTQLALAFLLLAVVPLIGVSLYSYLGATRAYRRAVAAEAEALAADMSTRVEAVGNQHYPSASRQYGIYGDLRLLVAIRYDGTIDNIEVLSSSGHAVLDEAAIRIVNLAAPFPPFPPEVRKEADILHITRTWEFSTTHRLKSH